MIGDWRDVWQELHELARRLEEIRDGRDGGSVGASADMRAFFTCCESLRDWVKQEIGDTGKHSRVDGEMKKYNALKLAHDIAIKTKHRVQTRTEPWTEATDAAVISQSVTIRVGASASHEWVASYTPPGAARPMETDAVALSREVLAAWGAVLVAVGLAP